MHGFPFCIRIACVLAERSCSAPQALGTRARDNCCCGSPVEPPPQATAQARPSQCACASSQPPT
eukprot:5594500-Pleurochrysis_carterae.AAC.1